MYKLIGMFLAMTLSQLGFSQTGCDSAIALFNAQNYQQALLALDSCEGVISEEPIYLRYQGACYFQLGQLHKARAVYLRVLQKDSLNVPALKALGTVYTSLGNWKDAKNVYFELIKTDSSNPYFFRQLAKVFLRLGEPVVAGGYYQQALSRNPEDLESLIAMSDLMIALKLFQDCDV